MQENDPENNGRRVKSDIALIFLVGGILIALSLFKGTLTYVIVILPVLVTGALGWFVHHVFLRKYLRARRISHARERRLWKEASKR